jgi:fructose-1,6-bisphosphatase
MSDSLITFEIKNGEFTPRCAKCGDFLLYGGRFCLKDNPVYISAIVEKCELCHNQRRFEAAKAAMQGYRAALICDQSTERKSGVFGSETINKVLWSSKKIASLAVEDADALLEVLDSKGKNNER